MSEPQAKLPGTASVGAVRLRTANPARSEEFYTKVLGLSRVAAATGALGEIALGVEDRPLVRLQPDPSARPSARPAPGLFHLAILLPSRADLGRSLQHLSRVGWPLQGASDHLVSEAIYLADPDGNGIEIYRDRPRDEWRWKNGEVAMATEPMDVQGVLQSAGEGLGEPYSLPPDTRMGHIHLQVSNLDRASEFYTNIVGFDRVNGSYPGARFVSAGGYHHHVGMNSWRTDRAARAPEGSIGLVDWELNIPDSDAGNALIARAEEAGLLTEEDGIPILIDPDGIRVRLV